MQSTVSLNRRSVLRGLYLGLGAAALPTWFVQARAQTTSGAELKLPVGPLAGIGAVEPKTLTAGAIAGLDDAITAPPGFTVRCVARAGVDPVAGRAAGFTWHVNPDGGAVFPAADGGWVYVSNCESTPGGGVGALRFDKDGVVTDAYPILTGTRQNCAGGATPWGTWLSCEEQPNGEVYECDPFGTAADAVKKPALGAFSHEAAAIDPRNHVCYLTEDGSNQRFWRFVTTEGDRTLLDGGITRLALEQGQLQVLQIEGFTAGTTPAATELREAKRASWVNVTRIPSLPGQPQQLPTQTTSGTQFNGGEGISYYELPEALRETPALGTVPTRGVIFFTTKGDNRVYAYDIENQLIELIFDNENMQLAAGYDDVDNLTVSPAGDVLVCEDGEQKRICVIVPNQPAKLLMQITRGGSEIAGAAFTPDGSRLYFSSQRGPSGADGTGASGATYEMTIPVEFRSLTPPPVEPPPSGSSSGGTSSGGPVTPPPTPVPEDPNAGRFGGGSLAAGTLLAGLAAAALRGTPDDRDPKN